MQVLFAAKYFMNFQLSSDNCYWIVIVGNNINASSLRGMPHRLLQVVISFGRNYHLCHSRRAQRAKLCQYSIIQWDTVWSCSNGVLGSGNNGMWNWKTIIPLFRLAGQLSKCTKYLSVLLWFFWIIYHANWISSSLLFLSS